MTSAHQLSQTVRSPWASAEPLFGFWLDFVYNERWLVNLFKWLLLFRSPPLSHLSFPSPAPPRSPTLPRGWHLSAGVSARGGAASPQSLSSSLFDLTLNSMQWINIWVEHRRLALSLSVLMLRRCEEVELGLWSHHAAKVSWSHLQQLDLSLLFFPLVRWTNVRLAGRRARLGLFSLDHWFWVVFICQCSPRLSSPPSKTKTVSDRVGWNWFQLLRTEVYF